MRALHQEPLRLFSCYHLLGVEIVDGCYVAGATCLDAGVPVLHQCVVDAGFAVGRGVYKIVRVCSLEVERLQDS